MKYIVCSIYNKDTKEYSAPVLYKTKKIAIADFLEKIEELKKKKYFEPSDWVLFCIGNFTSTSGNLLGCDKIKFADGSDNDDLDDDVEKEEIEEVES